eukprot:Ihof_evm21s11 gene=Ihof_evmTU21s11
MDANVLIAQKYMDLRIDLNIDALLELVTDDIIMESTYYGTYTGKAEFRSYLEANLPRGAWEAPKFDEKRGKVIILGMVKILL